MVTPDPIQCLNLLKALIHVSEAKTINSSFIQRFNTSPITDENGQVMLQGNFNLNGTKSGRMSSSGPNLMNLPSNGKLPYTKAIKECFRICQEGDWIMGGADFSSLEDMISALTTKDPNKLKVYIEGYDGHCLRAYFYFKHLMPDITLDVKSINSIKKHPIYKQYRQDSKAPTFALTYKGTAYTLMKNLGFSEKKSKAIEAEYHRMYVEADAWVDVKLAEACNTGYVDLAFGLKLRTPSLHQTIYHAPGQTQIASQEERTAGNALGQSYGLLNNRAAIEFRERVMASPFRLDIKPIAHIHDAQYFLFRKNSKVLHWVNTNLIECMQWQDLPDIIHPTVKLGGQLEIYFPSWAQSAEIPNGASELDIIRIMAGLSYANQLRTQAINNGVV